MSLGLRVRKYRTERVKRRIAAKPSWERGNTNKTNHMIIKLLSLYRLEPALHSVYVIHCSKELSLRGLKYRVGREAKV
jgi:hypothetical protein